VFAGQVRIALRYRYLTASLHPRYVLPLAFDAVRRYPSFLPWIIATMAVESWSRLLGFFDALARREDHIWRPIGSTKAVAAAPSEPLTLVSVKWSPGSLDWSAFLRELQRLPEPAGSVFWWDRHQGEVLLLMGRGKSPLESVQGHIDAATRAHSRRPDRGHVAKPLVSYQLLRFSSWLG
jgi:hypothetical protein